MQKRTLEEMIDALTVYEEARPAVTADCTARWQAAELVAPIIGGEVWAVASNAYLSGKKNNDGTATVGMYERTLDGDLEYKPLCAATVDLVERLQYANRCFTLF